MPEIYFQKDYGPKKLGPQRWAAHKDGSRKMVEGEKVRLGTLIIPKKLRVPEIALSEHVKITLTIWGGGGFDPDDW